MEKWRGERWGGGRWREGGEVEGGGYGLRDRWPTGCLGWIRRNTTFPNYTLLALRRVHTAEEQFTLPSGGEVATAVVEDYNIIICNETATVHVSRRLCPPHRRTAQ